MSGLGKKIHVGINFPPVVIHHPPAPAVQPVIQQVIYPSFAPPNQPAPSAPIENFAREPFTWMPTSIHHCDHLLHKAVQAGHEGHDGSPIYVGRAFHNGDLIPCKVIPRHRAAYVAFEGREVSVLNIELYCRQTPRIDWVPSAFGSIPPGAVVAGHTSSGESLYVGRTHHNGSLTPGKVHCSHRCCYIPFAGQEIAKQNYEVMVVNYS